MYLDRHIPVPRPNVGSVVQETNLKTRVLFLAFALLGVPVTLNADGIPYSSVGTQALAYTFTATDNGPITAYFYGSSAAYDSVVGLSANNVSTGIWGLNNHLSNHGDSIVFGNVNAGDVVELQLYVNNLGYSWSSNPANNWDGFNHVYATSFGGDWAIPAGMYIGFEDLPGGGDIDYNDHQFVFTNLGRAAVPEPGTMVLLGAGLLSVFGTMRRKLGQ